MDKLSWVFELIDRVSGPANAASTAMDRVDRTMRQASADTDRLAVSQRAMGAQAMRAGNAASRGMTGMRGGVARAMAAIRALGAQAQASIGRLIPVAAMTARAALRGLEVTGRTAMSAIGGAIRSLIASPLAQLAAAVAPFATALAVAKGQLDAIVSRQRLVRGFDVMLGEGQGERVMQRVVALSDQLGVSWEETSGAARELFSKGFGEERVFELIQGFADLRAVNPGASLDRIALAMGQVRQAGRLQGDELNQLAEGGLNLSRVMPRIAEALNIDPTKVRDAMRSGLITADIFETAVLGAMQEQAGGQIGAIAEDMSHSLGGEIERLMNAPGRFFERVAANEGGITDRLTVAVRRMNELLDPQSATGQKIIEGLTGALEGVANALTWATTHGEQLERVGRALNVVWVPIMWTMTGLVELLGWVADATELVVLGYDALTSRLRVFGATANIEIMLALNGIKQRVVGFATEMFASGVAMVQGLVNGLMSVFTLPVEIISNMGTGMLQALRTALGIHSPSREFAYLGEMAGLGFTQGLSASGFGTAMDGSMQAPEIGSPAALSALMGSTINLTINVTTDEERSIAEQIRDVLLPELSAAFESLAIETGS